jgi:hypothetical protein
MTFEQAVLAALDGQLLRRCGWSDPDRVAYRVLVKHDNDYSYYTLNIGPEDADQEDWYCCGWLQ